MRIMAGKGNANRRMGAFWERQAAEYLEQKGYQILERNFCSYFGEIDIIARQGSYLALVKSTSLPGREATWSLWK